MIVADLIRQMPLQKGMLDSVQLIEELTRLRADGVLTNAELARLLNLPSPRIAEIFSGKRAIKIDEMKLIVERYGLEPNPLRTLNAESLEPLLDALLPLVPPSGRMTAQSRRALAEAFSYALGMLASSSTNQASADVVEAAARASAAKFRELMH